MERRERREGVNERSMAEGKGKYTMKNDFSERRRGGEETRERQGGGREGVITAGRGGTGLEEGRKALRRGIAQFEE